MTGRPTLLNDDLKSRAKEYLTSCPDTVPSAAGLAVYLKVAKSSIYLWSEKDKEFSDTLADIQAAQENKLLNKGLTGEYNSTITKLMLANHGYSDKVEQTNTGEIKIIQQDYDADL